jgi:hypothetical protein
MKTRTITRSTHPESVADGSRQWASDNQPWTEHGIHIQYRASVDSERYVACEAVDVATGELLASSSHPSGTNMAVRQVLARR